MKGSHFPIGIVLILMLSLSCFTASYRADKPNIVFILTDDQDVALGGETPMAKTKKLIGDEGVVFENMFTSSPLCCPSRSSIFTGRYVHNHGAVNNSIDGNCSSPAWQQTQEVSAFPTVLKALGYTTFFAGKYLNQYGFPATGGVEHVPPGWDSWMGLVGNSVYYNYALSVDGKQVKHGTTYPSDYLTDVIHKGARQFLDTKSKEKPFFMMLSTPACHGPFTPAPQYNNSFPDKQAPRNGSYNVKAQNKHWLLRQPIVPMPDDTVKSSDDIFRRRWRTLLSVDDMVEDVIDTLQRSGELDNTYIFFSSDNGYHLGQFGLPYDKRQLYDFDIRVPLMVRGPGIKPGQVSKEVAMNIDFAPTFADIAGHVTMPNVDGITLMPILHPQSNQTQPLRQAFLVEHQGEYSVTQPGCPQYKDQNMDNCNNHCVCEDSKNNSFGCVIQVTDKQTLKYCEFQDKENFIEIYDTTADPYELKNLAPTIDPKMISDLGGKLRFLANCAGPPCNSLPKTGWWG